MLNIIIFSILTIINVTLSTIRSLCTIKCGKWVSALSNAICYGFYPLIVMLTARDMVTIVANMIITAVANFVCVWIIKYVEEKARKDKLWEVQATVLRGHTKQITHLLDEMDIPHNYIENVGKYSLFNIFCATQKESRIAKDILERYGAKYFASEGKVL